LDPLGQFSDEEVRRAAAEVLARPDYAGRKVDEAAWLAFLQRIRDAFEGFQGWMIDLSTAAPLLYWTIIGSLLLISIGLFAHLAWTVRVALRAAEPEEPQRAVAPRRDLHAEAEAAAREGRYLAAVRLLHADCLEVLLRREVIAVGRGATNRDLRRQLARSGLPEAQQRSFAELLDALERQLFRDREDDRDLYFAWLRLAAEVRSGSARPRQVEGLV
jgi:hypothetical protein